MCILIAFNDISQLCVTKAAGWGINENCFELNHEAVLSLVVVLYTKFSSLSCNIALQHVVCVQFAL